MVSFLLAFPTISYMHSSSPPFLLHAPPISSFKIIVIGHFPSKVSVEALRWADHSFKESCRLWVDQETEKEARAHKGCRAIQEEEEGGGGGAYVATSPPANWSTLKLSLEKHVEVHHTIQFTHSTNLHFFYSNSPIPFWYLEHLFINSTHISTLWTN
jgi:hypothetical protein